MTPDRPFILALARQPSDFGDVCRALKHNVDLLRMMCLYKLIGGREVNEYEIRAVQEANRVLKKADKKIRVLEVEPVDQRQHHITVTWKDGKGISSQVLNMYPPSFRRKENPDELSVPNPP